MDTKSLPRPLRRRNLSDLAARLPIPYMPTCEAMGFAWPTGKNVPTLAETQPRPASLCEECGKPTNGGSRSCGWCDPLAD